MLQHMQVMGIILDRMKHMENTKVNNELREEKLLSTASSAQFKEQKSKKKSTKIASKQ